MVSFPGSNVRLLPAILTTLLAGCVRFGLGVSSDGAVGERPAGEGRAGDATRFERRRPDGPLDPSDARADTSQDVAKDLLARDLAKADLLARDLAKADLPKDLAKADLPAKDLKADLRKDLAKGDLLGKDLAKADLRKDLAKADLLAKDLAKADLPTKDLAVGCPTGYSKINGSTSSYRVATVGNNWLPAEQACEAEGTHLMIIDDANEGSLVGVVLPGATVWTGVTDRITSGQFRKVTGPLASYLPWAAGQPVAGGIRCTIIDSTTGLLSNIMCGAGRLYLCECDGQKAVAGSY